jgi:hypothetical protein
MHLSGLFKSHPVINLIALTILTLGFGWGLSMIIPSTPHNGFSIIIITLVIAIPFFIWDYIIYRKIELNVLPNKGVKRMIFILGIIFIVVGFALVITQLNFKTEAQATVKTQSTTTTSVVITTNSISFDQLPTFVNGNQLVTLQLGMINMKGTVTDLMNAPHSYSMATSSGTYNLLSFYISNHAIYIDTTLYGGDKLPQVQLKQNVLVSIPQNWDFNSDGNAIEIVNQNQQPIFQLIYKSQYYIVINGYLYYPGGFTFVDEDGRMIQNPQTVPVDYSLAPIFKYPSSKYPGQRIGQ